MSPNLSQGQETAVVSQREWLALQNFGWKRLRGREYMDNLSQLWYYHIVRSPAYSADSYLNALFDDFTKTYSKYLRLKVKGRRGFWNFLWSLLVSGILIFVGIVFAAKINFFFPAEFCETLLSSISILNNIPAMDENLVKILAISFLAAGALLFFLYTFLRTLIIIPVRRAHKKRATIDIMLQARNYITGKKRKSKQK